MTIAGRCVNFGKPCSLAESKQAQPMTRGAPAYCAECGERLVAVAPPPRPWKAVLIGIGAVVVALIVLVVALRPKGDPTQTALTSPAPSVASVAPIPVRLCGSSTMAQRLGPRLLQAFITPKDSASPPRDIDEVRKAIASEDTNAAFTSLAAKTCDVGMASRQITAAERSRLRALGDMSSRESEHVIGIDGITVLVNRANPVSALSTNELRSIYAGSVIDWSALHGTPGQIRAYAPTVDSGTVDSFKLLVMGGVPFGHGVRSGGSYENVAAAVARDKFAVGFVPLPYADADRAKPLKVASGSAAMAPTVLTVVHETYPLSRRLYLYTAARPANPAVVAFVKFAQSDEGQLLVERAGFVGSTVHGKKIVQPAPPPKNAPHAYVQQSHGLHEGYVFYFKVGSPKLDNLAYTDIERLVKDMSRRENRNVQIFLAGFTDSTGSRPQNQKLSQDRADSVKHELVSRGVKVKKAIGFGDAMPIRDNRTDQGREKNRRVEVFVPFTAGS